MAINLNTYAAEARWITGKLDSGHDMTDMLEIPFQGSEADTRGYARIDTVILEDGQSYTALRTHPKWTTKGTIKGFFPWMELPEDAVFEVDIGFVAGAEHTDGVHFQVWVHYLEQGKERWYRIESYKKNYNGHLSRCRCDLSRFSGKRVSLELRCDAINSAAQDWAVWVNPRVISSLKVGDLPFTVALNRFYCYNADEDSWYSNGDEPYLFVFVIVIDGYGIQLQDLDHASVRIYSAPRTHGNLNKTHVEAGQNFAIPADTGQFQFYVKPVEPLGATLPLSLSKDITQIGLAVIAMEEDATPTSTANLVLEKTLKELQTKLDTLLREKIQAAVSGGNPQVSQSEISQIVQSIQQTVVETATKDTLKKFALFGMVDPDDYVGAKHAVWTYNALENAGWQGIPFNWEFKATGVRYGVTGKIKIG